MNKGPSTNDVKVKGKDLGGKLLIAGDFQYVNEVTRWKRGSKTTGKLK